MGGALPRAWDPMTTNLSCKQLLPLTQGHFQGETAVWQAVLAAEAIWRTEAARAQGYASARGVDPDDLVHDAMALLFRRILERTDGKVGLKKPEPCESRDPTGWFRITVRNLMTDRLRQAKQREVSFQDGEEGAGPRLEHLAADQGAVDEQVGARRRLEQLRQVLAQVSMPPTHRLAFLCLEMPDLVTPQVIADAVAYAPAAGGILRPEAEVQRLVVAFLVTFAGRESGSQARTHLAWILRTDDTRSAETWKAEAPAAVRTARDTLRKWSNRARSKVEAALSAAEVSGRSQVEGAPRGDV